MHVFREGKVVDVAEARPGLLRATVELRDDRGDTHEIRASGYPHMLGPVAPGQRVLVNVIGLELDLGTGGEGFILWNLDGDEPVDPGAGHIVKLRYSPWQMNVLAAEAPESEHHVALRDADELGGCPVVACGLHSQVVGVVAGIRAARPDARVAYVMSDAGALPLAWSETVAELEERGEIAVTCTYGHAFGGDLEAVNVYSALAAARVAGRADVIVAAMGPGGVGTGTKLGFSGIEQGQVLDAAAALGGHAIACVRVSFGDERERHRGISHHSITALTVAAARRATVVLPRLEDDRMELLRDQCREAGIYERHEVVEEDGSGGVDRLREDLGLRPRTMGRPIDVWPEPFLAAAAAGAVAAGTLA